MAWKPATAMPKRGSPATAEAAWDLSVPTGAPTSFRTPCVSRQSGWLGCGLSVDSKPFFCISVLILSLTLQFSLQVPKPRHWRILCAAWPEALWGWRSGVPATLHLTTSHMQVKFCAKPKNATWRWAAEGNHVFVELIYLFSFLPEVGLGLLASVTVHNYFWVQSPCSYSQIPSFVIRSPIQRADRAPLAQVGCCPGGAFPRAPLALQQRPAGVPLHQRPEAAV